MPSLFCLSINSDTKSGGDHVVDRLIHMSWKQKEEKMICTLCQHSILEKKPNVFNKKSICGQFNQKS